MTGRGEVAAARVRGRGSSASRVALLLPLVLLVCHAWLFEGPSRIVDDAWISYRYGHNLATGEGLTYNPPDRVQGYTDFSWVLIAAGVTAVSLPVERVMPAIGLICALAVVAIAIGRARRQSATGARGPPHALSGLGAGLTLAFSTGFACYAVTGLETSLFTLLMLGAALGLVDRRPARFALFTAAAFLTRPEAGLMGVAGVLLMLARPRAGPARLRDPALATALMAAVVLPYLIFEQLYFGSIVPNTLAAKLPSASAGLDYVLDALWKLAGVPIAALVAWRTSKDRRTGELLALTLLFWVAVVLEGGDWMPTSRMLVPTLPWIAIAADDALLDWAHLRRPRTLSALGLLMLVPFLGVQAMDSHTIWKGFRIADPVFETRAALAHRWARQGVRSVALVDIGLTGYAAPHLRIVDLAGLTDRTIAAAPGGHLRKRLDFAYLESLAPDLVVLTSKSPPRADAARARPPRYDPQFGVERALLGSRWLRAHYRFRRSVEGHERYWMHLYERIRPGTGPGRTRERTDIPTPAPTPGVTPSGHCSEHRRRRHRGPWTPGRRPTRGPATSCPHSPTPPTPVIPSPTGSPPGWLAP